jgi:hypothetical protein
MAQQTAVEWLIEQIESGKIEIVYSNKIHSIKCIPEIKEQAKKMFEQQIMEAFDNGDHCIDLPDGSWKQKYDSPEQYYNETYGNNNKTK